MFEFLSLIAGGFFRIVPEALKMLDAKNERAHEKAMLELNIEADKSRGLQQQRLADIANEGLDIVALQESAANQMRLSGVKWIDALNSLMRPMITMQWVVFLWPLVIICSIISAHNASGDIIKAIMSCFGSEEKMVCLSILSFWFVDRSLRKYGKPA